VGRLANAVRRARDWAAEGKRCLERCRLGDGKLSGGIGASRRGGRAVSSRKEMQIMGGQSMSSTGRLPVPPHGTSASSRCLPSMMMGSLVVQ